LPLPRTGNGIIAARPAQTVFNHKSQADDTPIRCFIRVIPNFEAFTNETDKTTLIKPWHSFLRLGPATQARDRRLYATKL